MTSKIATPVDLDSTATAHAASGSASLTPKQQCFVAEHLIDRNATKAAIRAGYSPKTAYSIGHENLQEA